jgi:hypothetical protein
MKFYLCAYSNKKLEVPRKALVNYSKKSGIFEGIFEYDRDWLVGTDFYKDNIDILGDSSKGDGWCLWKPYFILESLKNMESGDVLLYMDSTDTFSRSIGDFLVSHFKSNDILLCQFGESPNKNYTRRDTFYYMGCDSPEYWDCLQLEAGVIGVKKGESSIAFIEEYLHFCKDPRIIKGGPNTCGLDNLPSYVDHRYDQSILTNLKTKYSIGSSTEIANYVECNLWEALRYYGNIDEFQRKIDLIKSKWGKDFDSWKSEYLINLF